MESPIKNIKLSTKAKDQLVWLKRMTRIDQWNVLCRWGFVRSLVEPSRPSALSIPADSNVELSWKVFGGEQSDMYLIALKQRLIEDGLPLTDEVIANQFRLHLHRGIGFLTEDGIKNVIDLVSLPLAKSKKHTVRRRNN